MTPSRHRNRHFASFVTPLALAIALGAPAVALASPPVGAASTVSPTTLLNEGNAQLRAGRVGRAVVAYERGLLLAPRDPDLLANMDRARAERALPPPPESIVEQVVGRLSTREWRSVGGVSLAALLLALTLTVVWPRRRRTLAAVALAGALVASMASVALWLGTSAADRAVVVAERTVARLSPFNEADTVFTLGEGQTVRICARHAGYLRVEDAQGHSGWVPTAEVQSIIPD